MATFKVSASSDGKITGTSGNDTYIVNPDSLGSTTITDSGGTDKLRVFDTPGRNSGEFFVGGGQLVWRNYEGDEVRFNLGPSNQGRPEWLIWEGRAENGVSDYTHQLKIQLNPSSLSRANVAVALTQGDDQISATLSTAQGGWSEVYGNGGNDTMTASDKHLFILLGGRGNDTLLGQGVFDDAFFADQGNDTLWGLDGNDRLEGGTGSDRIFGGNGSDIIVGGGGQDALSGGSGADDFIYMARSDSTLSAADRISEFAGGRDEINLWNIDARQGIAGNQEFQLDTNGSFSRGEIRQTQQGANLLIEMNTDSDSAAEMAILLLNKTGTLSSTDFVL